MYCIETHFFLYLQRSKKKSCVLSLEKNNDFHHHISDLGKLMKKKIFFIEIIPSSVKGLFLSI